MANYTFTTYWVEGTKEAIHQLHDAIANADGWTSKAFKNLGINTEGKEEEDSGWFRAEWHNPKVEDKDDYSVLQFEECYPWVLGTMMRTFLKKSSLKGNSPTFTIMPRNVIRGCFRRTMRKGNISPTALSSLCLLKTNTMNGYGFMPRMRLTRCDNFTKKN